jgi:hypothetical protein
MEPRMNREMDQNSSGTQVGAKPVDAKVDALFAEYRSAVPDIDGGVNFMRNLWLKIEARRNENVSVFRRLAQVCVLATAALTLAMAILIPRIQTEPVYTATYVDVLDAAHSVDSAQLMDSGELQ